MKKILTTIIITSCYLLLFAQQPILKQWDGRYGGTSYEGFKSIFKLPDGGYVLGGFSLSGMDGNKSQPNWGGGLLADYWLVKLDSNGNKQWDKRYGGLGEDGMFSMALTNDGGFILAGYSSSGIGGDKTQDSRGGADYWIVKVDGNGNQQWDKRFGGSGNDFMYGQIIQTQDKGYIFGGYSTSNAGGDKTENNRGSSLYYDFWVVKTDSIGNKQWDKTFGGIDDDAIEEIIQTDDGGYLLGGHSWSNANGDKTAPKIGGSDWWVVKIDSSGNKEWDKTYGTVLSDKLKTMCKTYDGNYILAGDGFIIRKIDNSGILLSEKKFDGCAVINRIDKTSDSGFLLSGEAYKGCVGGPLFPDKSEANLGRYQTWFVKTDSAFNKQWDKTVFSPGEDYEGRAIEADNGCYVIASDSRSDVGGYKSQPNWDTTNSSGDIWIVKLCEDSLLNLTPTLSKGEGVGMVVYPNPFTDDISITIEKENLKEATFAITTTEGKIIYTQHETQLANRYTKILDVRNLASGVYLVSVAVQDEVITRRIIKQ
jgi:hypothetical protein